MRITTVTGETRLLELGKQGEHLAHQIQFPFITTWKNLYGEGTFVLFHRRHGDTSSYLATNTEIFGNKFCWNVSNIDVANMGQGEAELVYYVGDSVVAKSITYKTETIKSDFENTETPDPWQTIADEVARNAAIATLAVSDTAEYAESASEFASIANESAESANEYAMSASDSATQSQTYSENAYRYANNSSQSANFALEFANAAENSADIAAEAERYVREHLPISWGDIDKKPTEFPPTNHNHNNLYYQKDVFDEHTGDTNIHTSLEEKEIWNNKFDLPDSGISKDMLDDEVQGVLGVVSKLTNSRLSLIETITLSQRTSRIERDKETDERAYDFNMVYVEFNVPAGSKSSVVKLYANSDDETNLCASFTSGISTVNRKYSGLIINKNGARIPISSAATSSLNTVAYPYMMIGLAQTVDAVNTRKIIIESISDALPVGTEIKIYAVRN